MGSSKLYHPTFYLTLPAFLLLSLGILVIYTSNPQLAVQQLIVGIIGFLLYWLISSITYDVYDQYTISFYLVVLALLVVVFLLGVQTRGSLRWIPIGSLRLQPSEFAKPAIILLLAKFWRDNLPTWTNTIKSFALIIPALALVFKQPDLGTTIVIFSIWLFMLIAANISAIKILILFASTAIFAPLTWALLKDYQRVRLLSFLSPQQDPLGLGYNVIQSTIAVGSGELFGRGLGRGTQSRLQFLPEYRTDFIFASIAEELGFVGCLIVIGLYGLLVGRIIRIIQKVQSRHGGILAVGVLSMILVQMVVNVGMNIGIMPITGITLPLLSYGGSSLLVTLICLGLVSSVERFGGLKRESE